jgi:hypothetical protein
MVTVSQRHADDEKADRVVSGITQEVEGVGLQRCRAGRQAGSDLNREHHCVDDQHDPEHPAKGGIASMRIIIWARVAAVHGNSGPSRRMRCAGPLLYASLRRPILQAYDLLGGSEQFRLQTTSGKPLSI